MSTQRSAVMTLWEMLAESPLSRPLAIAVLMLFFLVPIEWIAALVSERMERRNEAVAEVSGKWGGSQRLTGPLVTVPFEHRWSESLPNGGAVTKSEIRTLTILPRELTVQAHLEAEERFRGIFSVPVYRSVLEVSGTFAAPDLAALRVDPALVDWARSDLVLGLADAHAIQNRAAVRWNDGERLFQSGTGESGICGGIHAPIGAPLSPAPARFSFQLIVNGSSGLYFTPVGEQTAVTVDSNWPDPSFQGSWLPGERSADAAGFQASWQIPFLGRNQPPAWTSATPTMIDKVGEAIFGVDLVTPVDTYRMAERSVKYARLFVLLTNEDYALLLGSLGVFAAVATAMLLTRHIDWYAGTRAAEETPAPGVLDRP